MFMDFMLKKVPNYYEFGSGSGSGNDNEFDGEKWCSIMNLVA